MVIQKILNFFITLIEWQVLDLVKTSSKCLASICWQFLYQLCQDKLCQVEPLIILLLYDVHFLVISQSLNLYLIFKIRLEMIYGEWIVKEIALLMNLKYCQNCWSWANGKSQMVFLYEAMPQLNWVGLFVSFIIIISFLSYEGHNNFFNNFMLHSISAIQWFQQYVSTTSCFNFKFHQSF